MGGRTKCDPGEPPLPDDELDEETLDEDELTADAIALDEDAADADEEEISALPTMVVGSASPPPLPSPPLSARSPVAHATSPRLIIIKGSHREVMAAW